MVVLWILAGWIGCVATAVALGLALFRLLHISLTRLESLCLGYVAGSAVLSFIVFAIGAMGIARKGLFLSLTVVAVAALLYFRRWLFPAAPSTGERIAIGWKILLAVGIIAYGNLYLRQAMAPEMSFDAMNYHLGLISLFNRAHGFVRFVDMYTGLPQGIEMLFFYAFAIGKHSAAALVHFSFFMDLAFLMVLYGKRFHCTAAGVAGALLVFASPLVGVDGTCAYNDVGLAAVTFSAVYLLALWRNEKSNGLLIACSIVTGFTMAVKYTAIFFALFVLLMILLGLRGRSWRTRALLVVSAGVMMSVSILPYLVRNAIWFDDPVAFFGNSVFRNPYFHLIFEQNYAINMAHLLGLQWKEMPMQLTTGGPHVEGYLGAVFLLAPLALIGVLWPQSRLLLLAALATVITFPGARSPRYLIPALPMIAIAMAFAFRRGRWWNLLLGAVVVAHLVTSWPTHLDRWYHSPGWHILQVPWKVDFRKVPESTWLIEHSEEYAITRKMDDVLPKGEPVFSMACPGARSYTDREIVILFQSAPGETLGDPLYSTWNSPVAPRRLWRFRFPPADAREVRLEQRGNSFQQQWSINELHLQSNGADIPIGPAAHPYAWPNPWDVGLAFDGSGVTRWRSWEGLKPGMHFGIRFDAPTRVDGLTILDFPDEFTSRMMLKVLTAAGQWLEEPPPALEIVPAVDLRKEAMQNLKRGGFHYILLSRLQWNGPGYIATAPDWGLKLVTETLNYKVYRIE